VTATGWIFMVCSVGFVVGLTVFCFHRVLTRPAATEHRQVPLETDASKHER